VRRGSVVWRVNLRAGCRRCGEAVVRRNEALTSVTVLIMSHSMHKRLCIRLRNDKKTEREEFLRKLRAGVVAEQCLRATHWYVELSSSSKWPRPHVIIHEVC
jgi:hypothetical protein